MFRSIPIVDRFFQFFSLCKYYLNVLQFKDCKKPRIAVACDMLELFFSYKTFPGHYLPCRLWETEKMEWKFYYGSNYDAYHRDKLKRKVQKEEYRILFRDKAVCEQLCRHIGIKTPYTYGTISPLEDYKEKLISWCRNSENGWLFLKPVCGNSGIGAAIAVRRDDDVSIKLPNKIESIHTYEIKTDYIVQEMVVQDKRMEAFSSQSVNTVRVITMISKNNDIVLLGGFLRFGIGDSYVDNYSAGGIAVGIDCKTGRLYEYGFDKNGIRYLKHPKTGLLFGDFFIPEWDRVVEIVEKIQKFFSFYRMLGADIALDESGDPIIIEINPCPDLGGAETVIGPLLKNKRTMVAFGEYDLFINRHQKGLYDKLSVRKKSAKKAK